MIFADPKVIPFTIGWVAGDVAPFATTTLAGVMVATAGVSLLKFTVTLPTAGVGRITAKGTDWLGPTVTPEGRPIGDITVTFNVASAMFGSRLAWITVDPPPTPLMDTVTLLFCAGIVTVAGTVAMLVLSE